MDPFRASVAGGSHGATRVSRPVAAVLARGWLPCLFANAAGTPAATAGPDPPAPGCGPRGTLVEGPGPVPILPPLRTPLRLRSPAAAPSPSHPLEAPLVPSDSTPVLPSTSSDPAVPFTPLLRRARAGDTQARSRLFEYLYAELRARASDQVRRLGGAGELQATELVNETYLKLLRSRDVGFTDRAHFLAVASRTMRQVLVDHVRERQRLKRGGNMQRQPLDSVVEGFEERAGDLVDLDDALVELASRDSVAARAVDLRFFAGLSARDTAVLLGLSERTFDRKWHFVRTWMANRLRR